MNSIIGKMNDGGPVFTYTILVIFFIILFFFVRGLSNRNNQKNIDLMASFAWFALAWGFLGRTIGLIKAFDNVAAHGDLTPHLLADGLKMALVDPFMGLFVFALARVGIIILIFLRKSANAEISE